ncbi:MAG: DNA modification methylase [Chloroflexota bacterium]
MRDPKALAAYLKTRAPLTSVVSYPQRGPWGDNRYPGNCSGYLLIDLCAEFRPRSVLDPMEGGGTSREVCADMGIPYAGYDLRTGTDSLHDNIGDGYDLIFWHPPYHDMKVYSDDPRDMSRAGSLAMFQALLRAGYRRFFELLAPGGRLAILIGDLRRRGRYEPLTADVARLDRAHIESIIVKIQHNVSSNSTRYAGAFVPILHETLTIFRRPVE